MAKRRTRKQLLSVKRPTIYVFTSKQGRKKTVTYVPGDKRSERRLKDVNLRQFTLQKTSRYVKWKTKADVLNDVKRRVKGSKHDNVRVEIIFRAKLKDGTNVKNGLEKIVLKDFPNTYKALLTIISDLFDRYDFEKVRMQMRIFKFEYFSKNEIQHVKKTIHRFDEKPARKIRKRRKRTITSKKKKRR